MRSLSRVLGMLTAVVLAGIGIPGVSIAAPITAAPPYTLEERAAAIARPALVLIEVRAQGIIWSKATGELIAPDPIVVYHRCSGFVVSTSGHVVTAGHCAQPSADAWRGTAFHVFADHLISQKKLTEDQKAAYVANLTANADFTRSTTQSQPEVKLFAQHNAVRSGGASIPGQVVILRSSVQENIALVKLVIGGLPVVEVVATPAGIDEQLTLLAYGSIAQPGGENTFVPRSRTAKISGLPVAPTGPSRLDADLGNNSHGGMAVDRGGKAVGLINADRAAKDHPRRLMVPAAMLKNLLESAGATNALGPTDLVYRAGLDAYFGGRYLEAIGRFDEVLGVVPDHQLATSYRKQAADRRAIEGEPESGISLGPFLIAGGLGALVMAGLMILIMVVLRRLGRRRGYRELAVSPYAPISAVPVSSYPVSGANPYSLTDLEPAWSDSSASPVYFPPAQIEPSHEVPQESERAAEVEPGPEEPNGNPWSPPVSR